MIAILLVGKKKLRTGKENEGEYHKEQMLIY